METVKSTPLRSENKMDNREFQEVIWAYGHENIQANHPTTLMFTKDEHLTKNGNCIVAVKADKATADLATEFKEALKNSKAKLTVLIEVGELKQQINAFGFNKLLLTNTTDIVIRKSNFVCNRTLGVKADKAAKEVSREMVEKLKDPKQKVKILLKILVELC